MGDGELTVYDYDCVYERLLIRISELEIGKAEKAGQLKFKLKSGWKMGDGELIVYDYVEVYEELLIRISESEFRIWKIGKRKKQFV